MGSGLGHGEVYSNEANQFLRVFFDRRAPATLREYLDRGELLVAPRQARDALAAAARLAAPLRDSGALLGFGIAAVADGAGSSRAAATSTSAGSPGVGAPPSTASSGAGGSGGGSATRWPADATTSKPDPTPAPEPADWRLLLLFGVVGGLAREVIRWRRLIQRKRHGMYLKGRFLVVSCLEVAVGGGAAVAFAGYAPAAAAWPVAFVCGAGLEALVRMAAKLKIWRPAVKLGEDPVPPDGEGQPVRATTPPSYLEYLGQ